MTNQHPEFATKNPDGVPVWPSLRTIDGYHYLLDSVHTSAENAEARVAKIRSTGDAAQSFTAGLPKFAPARDGLYAPAFAAVYTVPKGKRVELNGDSHLVVDRPSPVKAEKAPGAKASAKPKGKRTAAKKTPAKKPAKKAAAKKAE